MMREAIVSMLYKGGGRDPLLCKSYRPISLTPAMYRVMMKCVQMRLVPALEAVLGESQVGYLTDGRTVQDNTILMVEMAKRMESEGRGGVVLQLDNTAAFDLAQGGTLCSMSCESSSSRLPS